MAGIITVGKNMAGFLKTPHFTLPTKRDIGGKKYGGEIMAELFETRQISPAIIYPPKVDNITHIIWYPCPKYRKFNNLIHALDIGHIIRKHILLVLSADFWI